MDKQKKKNRFRIEFLIKNPLVHSFIFLLVCLIFLGGFLAHIEANNFEIRMKDNVNQVLTSVKATLENRLYLNIHRTEGIKALVAMNPNLTQEDFTRAMEINFSGVHDLRNIGLAKGMIIQYMYPLKGNEAAIGLDFTKNTAQFATADLARTQRKTVIAGPLNLVQGGVGLIARIPIYLLNHVNSSEEFWGLASVVINLDDFYEACGLYSLPEDVDLAIRGTDALGANGDVFWGNKKVFELDPITMNIELPYGSWQIAAMPKKGWANSYFRLTPLIALYGGIALLLLCANIVMIFLFERLRLAEAESKRLSQAKSEFLANMSHEIRTPLNSVIGFTDLLGETGLSGLQRQYVESVNGSGRVLLGIINDILDFSKIEADMLHLEFVKTDLMLLVAESIDMVRYAAAKKKLELLIDVDDSVPRFAMVDGMRLKQILINLLGNAVKFTEYGEIELKLGYESLDFGKGKLSFSVSDTGIGITEEHQEKLFKAFSQADGSTTRKFGGTGLGLIISEMIAKKMSSHIFLNSTEGQGTTFYFDLFTETFEGMVLSLSAIQTIKHSLIIDDNQKSRVIIERLLSSWDITYESCDNGLSGLELIKASNHYDVILCDYHMPGMNGIEVSQKITDYLVLKQETVPIVLMHLGAESDVLHKNSASLGVVINLIKPIVKETLFACLHQLCETSNSIMLESDTEVLVLPECSEIAAKKRILIADDVKMNVRLLKAVLEKIIPRAEIIEAVDGTQVLKLFETGEVNLIFMDVQMPILDGIEATQTIRKLEREHGGRVPIIALTAGVLEEEREKCLTSGMDAFVGKPFEAAKIKELLERYLK